MSFSSSKKSDIPIPHNYKARNSRHQSSAGLTPGSPMLLLTAPGAQCRPANAVLYVAPPPPGQGSPPVIDILLMCHNTHSLGTFLTFLLNSSIFHIK